MTRIKWGKGKVEVFALKTEILELLSQGQNQTEIFQQFTTQGKLTVGMRTFSRHVKFLNEQHQNRLNSLQLHGDPFLRGSTGLQLPEFSSASPTNKSEKSNDRKSK